MSVAGNNPGSVSDDEDFIRFMQVAQEDEEMRVRLISVLSQDDFNRQSLLNTWLSELELQNAPQELRRVLAHLLDGEVALAALRLLQG
ncbi:hypothetical protein ACFL6T_04365 [Candidatus Zixiibacteriota bacterium]